MNRTPRIAEISDLIAKEFAQGVTQATRLETDAIHVTHHVTGRRIYLTASYNGRTPHVEPIHVMIPEQLTVESIHGGKGKAAYQIMIPDVIIPGYSGQEYATPREIGMHIGETLVRYRKSADHAHWTDTMNA